jgi:hypothetical protein
MIFRDDENGVLDGGDVSGNGVEVALRASGQERKQSENCDSAP